MYNLTDRTATETSVLSDQRTCKFLYCLYFELKSFISSSQDESLDLSFLQHIREVTGYVLISHVDVARIVLPSLQIIRGRTLFKLNVQDDQFALMVTLSKMHNLEMPALRGKNERSYRELKST